MVIRGRGAVDVDGTAMCAKAELAEEIGKSGLNVMAHLCRLKGKNGEPTRIASLQGNADIWPNFGKIAPAIRIMPHAAMFVRRNKRLPDPDLIVVDESFWRGSHRPQAPGARPADRSGPVACQAGEASGPSTTPRRSGSRSVRQVKARKEADDRKLDAEDFARRVRSAFEDGRDPRTVVTAEEAGIVAGVEWGSRTGPGITPGMAYEAQRQRVGVMAA